MGENLDELWAIALDQHGYVTSRDAAGAGIDRQTLVNLAHKGATPSLRRVAQGIYRFPEDRIPVDEWDAYALAALWPAGQGVLSHETALQLHDLCDVNPAKIHVTVPVKYRARRKGAEPYVLHHSDLAERDITWLEGIRIVTPTLAIRQGIAIHTPLHLLHQAIATTRARGLARQTDLDQLQAQMDEGT
jgi:predicted transcriptional regulator of viral defense system